MHDSVPLSTSEPTPQRVAWGLVLITFAGFLLRIAAASEQPLWSDEALTLVLAKWPVEDLVLRPVDPTPGLYYLLHKWLIPDSAGLVAIRSISIVAGTLSIPAIYAVGRLAISRSAGLLSAAVLALSPALIDYSDEARVYALEILLVLLSAGALLAWHRCLGRKGGGLALIIFAIATVLTFSSHLAAIFWVVPAVPLAFVTTLRLGTRTQKRLFLLCAIGMALGAALEAQRLLWRASMGGGFVWLSQAGALDALIAWSRVLFPLGPLDTRAISLAILFLFVALIGWRILARRTEWRSWRAEHRVAALVIAIVLLTPIAVWLTGFILVPIFMPRTILITIPGFILLLALLVHLEHKPWLGPACVLLFALSLCLTGPVRNKEDWRAVAAALTSDIRAGDVVLVCPEWKYPALRHAINARLIAPGITIFGDRMVVIDRSIGGDRDWMRRYFRTMLEPQMRFLMKQGAELQTKPAIIQPFRRAWIVASGCAEDGRETTVRSWLGRGRWTLTVSAPPTAQHAPIRLWRFDPDKPVSRLVLAIKD